MRRYLAILISIGLFGWFVFTRRADLAALPAYMSRVTAETIVVLAVLEFVFLTVTAQSNRLLYRSLGVRNSILSQIKLLLAAGTIERLLPSGGAAGMSSYVWLAGNQGVAVSDSVKMTATSFILGYAQVVPLLLIPFFDTSSIGIPPAKAHLLIGVSAGFVVLIFVLAGLLGSARFFTWMTRGNWNRRFPRVFTALRSAHEYLNWSWENRRVLILPLLLLWLLYPIRVAMLWMCFTALHVSLPLAVIWTGYSITILISFLTFLPTTLGVFELSMVNTFTLLGVPGELGTAVTLLYRAFTYWLPIPFGLLSWWKLRRKVIS